MVSKGKSRRRLALMVALALSTGGGCLTSVDGGMIWGMSKAYAADVTVGVSDDRSGDVIGGTTDNNTVTIGAEGGGDHPVIGGNVAGGTSANASGNTVTINSIQATAAGNGTIFGGLATGTASNNTVIFKGGSATSLIGGATTGASGGAQGNTVTVSGGNLSYVWGGLARIAGTGSATGNTVNINGGTFSSGGVIIGGGGMNGVTGNMSGNTVTITGGALNNNNKIYAGDSRNLSSTSNGNIVNLGDKETGKFDANLRGAEIWGTSYGGQVQANESDKIKGNTLNVNASGIRLEKVRNFEKINFNLTPTVTAGSTMLTMDTGNFELGYGKAFDWKNFSLTGKENDTDKTKYGRIGNINLLLAYSGSDMKIGNYTAGGKKGTTGDYEYHMESNGHTFAGEHTASLIKANVDRFQNADATADNVTGTEVYGGYSSLGNTTTNNKIKITNTNNTNLNVYGGYTAGAGDSTNNHVTVSLDSRAKQIGKMVVGGTATASDSAIVGNSVTVEGGYVGQGAVGGLAQTSHTGSLKNNTFTLKGDGAVAMAFGALAQGGSGTVGGDSADDGNHVVIEGGRAADGVYGAATMGTGKVAYNTVTISGGEIGSAGAYGGANMATGTGMVTHNSMTVSGGKTEGPVYGGFSRGTGTVTDNTVTINGGRFENTSNIYGGYAHGNGTTTGNIVNLGDDTHRDLSGATLSESNIYGGNKAAMGNTLNVNAKNVTAKSVNNFENYKFKLNSETAFGDTMLTVANAGAFDGTGVDMNKITVDRTGLSADYLATQHGIKRMTLLKRSNDTDTLTFANYAAREAATATETHEFRFVTNNGTGTANALLLEASRFKGSNVTYDGTTPTFGGEVYGGLSRYGHATTGNTLTVTGKPTSGMPLKYAYGGKNEGATGDVKGNTATLELPDNTSAIKDVYGGKITNAANAGEVSGNIVNMKQGTVEYAVGGQTSGTGAAKNNTVNLTGGTVTSEIYGGLSDKGTATGNTVTISGGTVGSFTPADVYGGKKTTAAGSSASNNTVNLGAEDGTYTADLAKANIHGDNSTDGAVNNNTLNVRGKNITVNSVDNFDKYQFTLNNNIKDGDTMLTLKNGGFGREIDFANNFGLDTSKLTGKPTGLITLVKSATGTLKFKSGYQPRDLGSTDNVEYFVGTDTGDREGSSVIMGYNIFKGNTWTYDGTNSPNAKELFGGVSYNNHTTESNTLTITNTSTTEWVGKTYGGKTAGRTGGAKNNRVVVENTGGGRGITNVYGGTVTNEKNATGTVTGNSVMLKNGRTSKVYGGYTRGKGAVGGSADGEGNAVTLENGTAGDVYGGAIDNADSTTAVTGNKVTIQNGTYNRLYGGHTKGKGAAQNNEVTISGGTSSDDVHGGYTHDGGAATGNKVTLTGGVVDGVVYGGYTNNGGDATGNTVTLTGGKVTDKVYAGYADGGAATGNTVNLGNGTGFSAGADFSDTSIYGGNRSDVTGNTLNVKGKNMTVKTAGKFEKYTFYLGNDVKDGDTLLTFAQAGGFDGDDVDWSKINLDGETLHAWSTGKQRTNTITLLNAAGMTFTGTANQRLLSVHVGMEYGLRTDHVGSTTASKIFLEANRFRDGVVDFTAATTGEALGGISHFGNTTESNRLTVKSLAAGAHSAYGGKTMGSIGGSIKNTVTVTGTGAGTLTNVYGGYVDNAVNSGNATGNTVMLTGGTVTGAVYGGYTEGSGKTTGNTVNIGDGTAATLAAGTNLANAMLVGGNKSEMTGNTLNVMVKDAAAKKAQNFENYTFHLTDHIAADKPKSGVVDDAFTKSRGTMLTLAEGFDGQAVDWSKVKVDTSKLSVDKTLGAITLMKSTAANKLKFSNYAAKNHAVSGDYEVVQRTDTNTSEANAVLIDVNRFRNGDVTYHNGDNNAKTYAGVSYGGNTAKGNKFTLKGISEGKTLQYVSGGRSEGTAGGAVKNTVNLLGTGKGTLEEVYGGYVGNVANAADVTENTVNIAGGTAKNVYGGYTRGTGKTVKNTVNIGYTDEAGVFHDVADGAKITGTIYGGSGSDATGNVLNVSGKIAADNVKNFESVKFHVRDTMASGTTLLTLDGAAATEGLDWTNVTLDEFKPAVKSYEAYRLTLMANEKGIGFRKGGVDTYAPIGAKGVTKGDYEAVLDTDTHVAQAKAVNAEIYRFHGNTATYGEADGAHDAAWGGRSVLGNDATDNTLTISGGTLKDAYGGWSTGKKADGTSGKTTGNTVNFTGSTVTGTIYGGNNGAAGNTLNVTGIQSAGDIKNFEKLHFDTSMAKAGDTILTLNGGKKTTGLDWQKVEAAGLDEASLATRTGVAREELFSLMANDKGIDFGTTYDKAKEKTVGDYEYAIAKEADAAKGAAAEKVVVRGFRFQNNADSVYETGDNKAAWGGRSIIGNTVQRNKLTVKGGTLTEAAYGGLSAKGAVTDNTLVLAGGTLKNAYGGFVEGAGDATKNTVEVQKDTQAQIYGGHAAQGEASGNILNLGAVNIGANVYGGSGKKTDGNVINLFGTKIKGTVTGGTAADGKANVLAIRAAGTEIGDFKGIQNLKFYLPEGAKSSMATMLRLGVKDKDIKGLNVDLNLSGAAKTLKREDVFSLMKVAEGGTLTTDEKIKGEVTGTQGVSLDYKFRVQKKGADELIAAVESVKMKDATKSLAETRTTATDVLGGGMTMLADAGVSAAVQAAASANANAQVEAAPMATNKAPSAKAASAANVQSGAYTAWAAQGGSSMRIHSGSYVDTHGYTLNVGFARKQDGKDSTLTFGPFVEYGRASYDSYLEDAAGTHGSGKVSYIGAGVLARQDLKSGLYLEGSVRGGRIKSDYEGNISGTSTSYDISNPYYAIHLGVGKETKLKAGDALETYLKYFFSHQNGTSGKLSTGEDYDFDAVNSHRLRLGARYTHDMGEEGKFYAGLAWEYEFNGEARATYQGMATPSPSLKGGSAMLELGYRFTPKKSRVSYDVNFSGWQGKREGFSGSVGVNWAF